MYIPKVMKNKISELFYDKEVSILETKIEIDTEGGVKYNGVAEKSKFKGNVNFSQCKKIQEEYGLDYKIEISITTTLDITIKINDIIEYQGIKYNVTDLFAYDSHLLILGSKWLQ